MTTQDAIRQWLNAEDNPPQPPRLSRPRWANWSTPTRDRRKAKAARRKAGRREL